ncbi:DUF2975 domain-containing protein [Ilumatobacter sp.]|uniref:DUF2975 domain-containing protein n=1 Tax=Ilumatobacter sp. TaxID=1967498 RepID=UPI003B52604E
MSNDRPRDSARSLGRAVEIIATIAMFSALITIVASLVGGNGLRITDRPDGTDAMMSIVAQPSAEFDIDLGDPLPTTVDEADGTTSVFGQAVVEIGGPLTVTASLLDPTPSQRVIWLIWRVSGPLLVLLVVWPIRQMARSATDGDPFTARNERRLWLIAGLVIIGGVVVSMINGSAQTIILGRSAASELFIVEFEISFLPIIAGLVIAALAAIWHIGVDMRDELDATI